MNAQTPQPVVGTGYIAAIGRPDDYPPVVASLIDQAQRRSAQPQRVYGPTWTMRATLGVRLPSSTNSM
jgi:hypothetical protein